MDRLLRYLALFDDVVILQVAVWLAMTMLGLAIGSSIRGLVGSARGSPK